MPTDKILVTGAFGQIGTVLIEKLIEIYGHENGCELQSACNWSIDYLKNVKEKIDIWKQL